VNPPKVDKGLGALSFAASLLVLFFRASKEKNRKVQF
jgi:hypothetical protein